MKKFVLYLSLFIGAYLVYAFVVNDPDFINQKLGNGYFITQTSAGDRAIGKERNTDKFTYAVYGHIVNYKNGKRFILTARIPRDSLAQEMNNSLLVGKSWDEKDKLLINNPFKVYYIIDKDKQKEYGPYSLKNFQQQCEKMKISEGERLQ